MSFPIVEILGVPVASLTMREAVEQAERWMDERHGALIATANAEMIMNATRDEELFEILRAADLVVPDGAGTVWAAHHLGHEMPERVAGYDLTQELLKRAPEKNRRVFFFGSAPGVAEKAKQKAEAMYPGIQIVGVRNGYFSEDEVPAIIRMIREAQPDLLLAALGVPKQEKWLKKYKEKLGVPVSIGVGGTLDVMAGTAKRAPVWMQKAKLEWLFRGILQPKRAGRLLALPKFVFRVHASKKH
ncbi:MAG: WecB/TagA/CpsF family glycosyltransferase [Synergistaceae bacterium]|nr:WecB/TagA/CpsF family glycosyltransferase [Synergistaceae bacterium]